MYQTTTVLKTTKAVLFRMRKKNTETELTMRSTYYLFGKNFACAGTSCPISETSYVGEGHCKDRRVSVWTEWRLFHVWSFRGWERLHCSLLPPPKPSTPPTLQGRHCATLHPQHPHIIFYYHLLCTTFNLSHEIRGLHMWLRRSRTSTRDKVNVARNRMKQDYWRL